LLVVAGGVVVLLALGALPGFLGSGDPYHVEAAAVEEPGPAIAGENLSERRFPYAFGAIEAAEAGADPARSEPYYTGPTGVGGFKGAFTHTPFEEFDEFEGRNGDAVERAGDSPVGDAVYVDSGGQRYRLEIVRVPEGRQ
jgi:hypothetical protein